MSDTAVYNDVVLLIPAYNEGRAIKDTIDKIPESFNNIVVVNDGSSDDTAEQSLKTRAKLVSHTINLGQGAALQTAIDYALLDPSNKYFVTFDADGQHNIEDVKKMLAIIKDKKLDVVLGSRFLGKTINIKPSKKIILKLAVKFTNAVSGLELTDTHNGLRVFTRAAAEKLCLTMPDYSHASEIIDRIAKLKLKYAEAPVTISYTQHSLTKASQPTINFVNILFDVILAKVIKS